MDNIDINNVDYGVRNPLEISKTNIKDLISDNSGQLTSLSMMDSAYIPIIPERYILPNKRKFFFSLGNKIYLAQVQKEKIKITVAADFVITVVKECKTIYNDKSLKKATKHYLLTLKNSHNQIEKDVSITGGSKSDYKQFQINLSDCFYDYFINMKEDEFKTFFGEFISAKVSSYVTLYTNPGYIEDLGLLYKNALATPNGIYWANEDGYIQIGDSECLKVADRKIYIPKLLKSEKSGSEITTNLLNNIIQCWDDADLILPLITLGHMVMAIHFDKFTKKIGVPTMIVYGDTASGKSTLVNLGLAIFGFAGSTLISGGSTAKSNEYLCANYNNMLVCIDDAKGITLTSSNFTSLVKEVYNGQARTKMGKYGRDIEYTNTCSPLVYSTNECLPNLQEVINRLHIVQIFGKSFNPDKFNYHSDNIDSLCELSRILPEVLKIPFDEIMEKYNTIFNFIREKTPIRENRIINNLAFAYTGVQVLLQIGNITIENLENKFIAYAEKQSTEYTGTRNIVDKVLSEIPFLANKLILSKVSDIKFQPQTGDYLGETWLCFNKKNVISSINKYYNHDRSKQIDEEQFLRYARNHKRYRGEKTMNYSGNRAQSICFNISGMEEFPEYDYSSEPHIMGDYIGF